jgi:hypothetical protein
MPNAGKTKRKPSTATTNMPNARKTKRKPFTTTINKVHISKLSDYHDSFENGDVPGDLPLHIVEKWGSWYEQLDIPPLAKQIDAKHSKDVYLSKLWLEAHLLESGKTQKAARKITKILDEIGSSAWYHAVRMKQRYCK